MALIRFSQAVFVATALGDILTEAMPPRRLSSTTRRSIHPNRRSLQQDNKAESIADLDPFAYMDGVSALWFGPDKYSEVACGYSDIVNKVPMTVDATIPIGSNSKLFTAVAIYQLQEQGLLDANADIAEYLNQSDFEAMGLEGVETYCPKLANDTADDPCAKITLRNLLSMSSGIYPTLNCVPSPSNTLCQILPYLANLGSSAAFVATFILLPLQFQPGTSYMYSNPNFILATYFVEKFSGMTFQEYLQKNIFEPAGLNNTSYDFWNDALAYKPKRPINYYKYYSNSTPFEMLSLGAAHLDLDLGAVAGTGGLISTMEDARTWWHVLFNRTTGGAPFFQNASSQLALLEPISFVANRSSWLLYFGQGIVVFCAEENCTNGIEYLFYQGDTLLSSTSNIMDYETMEMSQIWTVTKLMFTTEEDLNAVATRQSGSIEQLTKVWFNAAWTLGILVLQQLQSGTFAGSAVPGEPSAPTSEPTSAPTSDGGALFGYPYASLALALAFVWMG